MKYAENQKYYGNHSSHESPLDQKSDTSHSLSLLRSTTVSGGYFDRFWKGFLLYFFLVIV